MLMGFTLKLGETVPSAIHAKDIMTSDLVTVAPEMTVMDAVGLLLKHKISGAPVMDAKRRLVGIMSELDCVNHISHSAMNGVPPKRVEDLMTRDVKTVPPETNLLTLVHHFSHHRYRRLPVVDDEGTLLGQISRRDLLRALYETMQVQQKRKEGPLYLSAIYGSDEAPARLVRGR